MPIDAQPDTKTLTAQCHCKSVHFDLEIPKTALPLKVHLCHCSICRYTHGTFCVFHAELPQGIEPRWKTPSSLDKLTGYRHDEAKGTRFFCTTCGCHIGDQNDSHWVISTSIFDANKDDSPPNWEMKEHIYTKTTSSADGLHTWLPKVGGREMDVWNPAEERHAPSTEALEKPSAQDQNTLTAACHCGGVSFKISRPTPQMLDDPRYKPWIAPSDAKKWLASMDVCSDCRLVSGAHVTPWIFVPRSSLDADNLETLCVGTSKTYSSSEGTLRSFCGTCGATVFGLFNLNGDRELGNGDLILDLAAGLLRAPEGLFAEEWLTWRTGRLAHPESGMAYDKDFTEGLVQGMESWGKAKHGEACDFLLPDVASKYVS